MQQVQRQLESSLRAGSLDHNVIISRPELCLLASDRFNAATSGDLKFVRMFSQQSHSRYSRSQHWGAEQTEFAVADHGDICIVANLYALENSTGRGEWFDEYGALV